jgi:excisionase family DNA binding protein
MTTNDLLDVNEGAAYCHIKPSTMRSWILNKKVTYLKLGRRVFLRRSDLDAFIERGVVAANEC